MTVQVAQSLNAGTVLLSLSGIGQVQATSIGNSQFQSTSQIPSTFAGPLTIIPLAVTAVNNQPNYLEGASVTVAVKPATLPTSISLAQQYFYVPPTIGSEQLALTGLFGGGSEADLTSAESGTTYASSNPAVVQVSTGGLAQVLASGTAVVTATNNSLRAFAIFVVQNPASPLPPAEVTTQFHIQSSGFTLNRNTGFFVQQLTLTNSASVPVPGPLYLLFEGLPTGVSLVKPSGLSKVASPGSPYISVPLGTGGLTLSPGQSAQFKLQFLDPTRARISYTPKVFQSLTAP